MVSKDNLIPSRRYLAALLGVVPLSLLFSLVAIPAGATVSFIVTELSGCTAAASQWDCLGQTPLPGSRLTIGIRVKSAPGDAIFGIGASVRGYDGGLVQFHSGEAVSSLFHSVAVPGIGAFDGLDNGLVAPTLTESIVPGNGARVEFLRAISLTARSENPLDPGLDGVIGGGDAQFRVRFDIVGFGGPLQFQIGAVLIPDGVSGAGGVPLPVHNAFIGSNPEEGLFLVQVPEPSALVLVGLGLVGLGSMKRGRPGERLPNE